MRTLALAALLALLLLAKPGPTQAQDPDTPPPLSPALNGLAQRLVAAKANRKGVPAATTRFTPSGTRLTLDTLVNDLVKSAEERSSMRQVFQEVFKAYEEEAKKHGLENDVAAAMAFYLAVHFSAYHDGKDVSDKVMEAVARQLQGAFDNDDMRATKNEDKQKLYEFCVMMGGFTAATSQVATEQKDADLKKQMRQVGGNGLRSILKIAPERVQITEAGLVITPEKALEEKIATVPSASSGGMAHSVNGISYRLPAEWSEKKSGGTITFERSFRDTYTNDVATLLLAPGRDKTGRIKAAFPAAWRELILSSFDGEQQPFVYVRRLGNGMNCAFSQAEMKMKSNGNRVDVILYLVDTGKAAYPIIGMFHGNISKYMPDIERLFESMKIAGSSPPAPLITAAEVAGDWSTSDKTYASYVNERGEYRGDASSAFSIALSLHADGTYSSGFMGIRQGSVTKTKESGTFKIEGDMLVMYDKARAQPVKRRFLGIEPLPDGKRKMLMLINPAYPLLSGNIGLYAEKYVLVPK